MPAFLVRRLTNADWQSLTLWRHMGLLAPTALAVILSEAKNPRIGLYLLFPIVNRAGSDRPCLRKRNAEILRFDQNDIVGGLFHRCVRVVRVSLFYQVIEGLYSSTACTSSLHRSLQPMYSLFPLSNLASASSADPAVTL